MPCVLVAVPRTVTCLSGASVSLSTEVSVTAVPLLTVAPAGMVRVALVLSMKSPATAGLTALAETVTVVSTLDG